MLLSSTSEQEGNKPLDFLSTLQYNLYKERVIFLADEIDSLVGNNIAALLLLLEKENPDKSVKLYLNSPGGGIDGLFAIYDMMQLVSTPIETICIGEACSAAAILLSAGTKGLRSATQNSRVMIHQIQYDGSFIGSGSELETEAKNLKVVGKQIIETLARHTGQNYQKVYRDCKSDKYMSAKEALKYGIIDKIIEPRKEIPELIKKTPKKVTA